VNSLKKLFYLPLCFVIFSCGVSNDLILKDQNIEIEGVFNSKKGVMHEISCHGYNIGFLKTNENTEVICFDKLDNSSDFEINCNSKIKVIGYFENHEVLESNGPCTAGTRKIFYVEKWECL
jgi:hypothetical protein